MKAHNRCDVTVALVGNGDMKIKVDFRWRGNVPPSLTHEQVEAVSRLLNAGEISAVLREIVEAALLDGADLERTQ